MQLYSNPPTYRNGTWVVAILELQTSRNISLVFND